MRIAAALTVLLVCSLGTAAPSAADSPSIRITEYGVYTVNRTGEVRPAPRTATGQTAPVDGSELVRATDQVFGQIGQSFGLRIAMDGFPAGRVTLTVRMLHPPLTNPDTGRTTRVSEYEWPVTSRRNLYFGYSFDHRWEIAEGDWTFQFVHDGRVLAERTFRVHVPLN